MEDYQNQGVFDGDGRIINAEDDQRSTTITDLDDTLFIYFADKSALDVLKISYRVLSSLIDLREYLSDESVCNILIIPDDDILRTLINVSRYGRIVIVRGMGVLDAPKDGLITPTGDTISVIDDRKFFEIYRRHAGDEHKLEENAIILDDNSDDDANDN